MSSSEPPNLPIAAQDAARERARERNRRGLKTRSNRSPQRTDRALPPSPPPEPPIRLDGPLDPPEIPPDSSELDPQAPAPDHPLPPMTLWARWPWAKWLVLALISIGVGVIVGYTTRQGPLVLSSVFATALAGTSFLLLWRPPAPHREGPAPPSLNFGRLPEEKPPPTSGPPRSTAPARPNRAARRAGAIEPEPQDASPVPFDPTLPEDVDVVDDPLPPTPAPYPPKRPQPAQYRPPKARR